MAGSVQYLSIEEPIIPAHSGSCYRRRLQMEPRKSLAPISLRRRNAFVLEPRSVDCRCRWRVSRPAANLFPAAILIFESGSGSSGSVGLLR